MRKNILLIVLIAAIFVFVGTMNKSAKAVDDPVNALKAAKHPVHLHSLAPGDELVHEYTSMIDTWWHSIWPPNTYCATWKVQDEILNEISGLDSCDKLELRYYDSLGVPLDSIWVHVVRVTKTLVLTREPERLDTIYVEFTGTRDSIHYANEFPVCTWWHGIYPDTLPDGFPVYCEYFHIDDIDPPGFLETCKIVIVNGIPWHVEDVAIDIMVHSIPDPKVPTTTQWGIIILVALIVSSGVFIMLRRRKAAVPA